MASSSLGTHLRACARATLRAVGGENFDYYPRGIRANVRKIFGMIERAEAESAGSSRGRRLTFTVHVEDHATLGIQDPDKLDEIQVAAEENGAVMIFLKYAKTVTDDGMGIIVMEFRA